MHPDDKRAQRERYLRALKKHPRSREEERRKKAEARARKAGRSTPRRVRPTDLDEDADDFEKIRRVRPGRRAAVAAQGVAPSPLDLPPDARRARVLEVHRNRLRVRAEGDGPALDVAPGGTAEPPVVGDHVWVGGPRERPRILALEPRRSLLARAGGDAGGGAAVLAANVDLGVVVASVRRPDLRPGLVARVRLALAAGGVESLLCLHKVDLLADAERAALPAELERWSLGDLPVLHTSVETGEGLDELRARLTGATSVLVGHSGVGKSSLLNALVPGLSRATGAGRALDGKGRHTTTSSALVEIGPESYVVDTPGVRAFGLAGVGRAELDAAFPELAGHAASCRFADCRHADEPGCAVRAAVADGRLPADVLAAWRGLVEEA